MPSSSRITSRGSSRRSSEAGGTPYNQPCSTREKPERLHRATAGAVRGRLSGDSRASQGSLLKTKSDFPRAFSIDTLRVLSSWLRIRRSWLPRRV